MAIAAVLARAAQGDALQHRHVVVDNRGFADHDAGAVVDHDALAEARRGVDVNAEHI